MFNQSTCVGFGYGLTLGLFPGTPSPHLQSSKEARLTTFVTTSRLRNIDLIPIGYGCRPRLRGRLTLRGLTLRRNPWTSGVSVSHTHVATRVSILASGTSRRPDDLPSQAYGTLRYRVRFPKEPYTRSFGAWLEPRYIFGAGWLN